MSEWQPARIITPHGYRVSTELVKKLSASIIRVRPMEPPAWVVESHSKFGCNAEKFYRVHPDDEPKGDGSILVLCEHEILTD